MPPTLLMGYLRQTKKEKKVPACFNRSTVNILPCRKEKTETKVKPTNILWDLYLKVFLDYHMCS